MDGIGETEKQWAFREDRMAEFLLNYASGVTFRFIAEQVFGDPGIEAILSSIAEARPDRFSVYESRVKLTMEERTRRRTTAPDSSKPLDTDRRGEQIQAAAAVQLYAEQLNPYICTVSDIGPAQRVGNRFLHAITLSDEDDDRRFIDDTPVTLRSSSGSSTNGYIAGTGRAEPIVYVAFDYELLLSDLPARLEIHRRKLWIDLSESLQLLPAVPACTTRLLQQSTERAIRLEDGKSLALDLSKLHSPWSRLLWGPPGSGKTYCLGWLTAYLAQLRRAGRILVVAPSNVAVDAATIEIVSAFESQWKQVVDDRRIVRFGYPRDERVLARPDLLGPPALEALSREIHDKDRALRKLREDRAPESAIATLRAEIRQLEEKRKKEVTDHLRSAAVVTTTIAAVCQSGSSIRESGDWDTVIVDECSMLNGALAMFLGSLAQKRYLLAGDPRQLAPIFEWRRGEAPGSIKWWLARDPYETIGFTSGEGINKSVKDQDGRVARLVTQRRCHPSIWATVDHLYPDVRPQVSLRKLESFVALHPRPGSPVVIFDVGQSGRCLAHETDQRKALDLAMSFESACRKVGKSWENPATARMAIELACDVQAQMPEALVSIITPYRAQSNLIRRWMDEEARANQRGARRSPARALIGTVHAFQGGQADVVIFDLVDGAPRSGPGALLQGDTAMRLVNVALTRARGKLILIADRKWVKEHCSREKVGLLWDVLVGGQGSSPVIKVLPPSSEGCGSSVGPVPESPIEEMFLAELKRRSGELPPFRLQVPITNGKGRIVSRADFAFVDAKVAIYCDGAQFHLVKDRWERDLRQRRELVNLGWRPMVYSGREIHRDVKGLVQELVESLRPK